MTLLSIQTDIDKNGIFMLVFDKDIILHFVLNIKTY